MTLLVVGLSHHSAPVSVLERASVPADQLTKVLDELHRCESISEVMLLSTCNRIEVYADVARFHPAVGGHLHGAGPDRRDGRRPSSATACTCTSTRPAAEHLLRVASGLDSMVVGESQILGQLRAAYATGTEAATVGKVLHEAGQTALRVGKRVHSETGIDRAGASVVSVALEHAGRIFAADRRRWPAGGS